MPLAYMEMILSSKSGQRVWYLRISFGSKLPSRSRGDLDRQIAFVVLERLGGLAVATVAAVPAIGGMFLVAEMIGELGFQDPFGHALLHALEQAVFAEEVLGIHPVFHQLVEKTVDLTWGLLVSGHSTSSL